MELSKIVYSTGNTSSSNDTGNGFAFPEIQLGGNVEMTEQEIALAASASPEGADFALTSGEFGGQGDLAEEGLGHEVGIHYLGNGFATVEDDSPEMGSDGDDAGEHGEQELADYSELESVEAFTGFDPSRADGLADELGENLVALAKEIAEELGADCTPEEFFAELSKRQSELAEEDHEVLTRAKRLGGLADAEQEASSVCRLADHGAANLRMVEGELLLVPAGAAPQDVYEAALRSRNDRLAKIARTHNESEQQARLDHSKEQAVRTMFEKQIRSNMKQAAERAKSGTPVADAKAEAVKALRAYRKTWLELPDERKKLIPDPATDAVTKRAFAWAASSRVSEASFKRSRDLGKAFAAPEVPFGGTPVSPEEQAEVLYIEHLRSTRQALLKAQPESPAANQAGLSVTRRAKVSAFYCVGEGVAHAQPLEEWFAPQTITVFGSEADKRRFQPMKALVANAIDALLGNASKPASFDPAAASNVWADQTPEAERESGPDQRGAATPREYNPAHRRDAQVVTATGLDLNRPRNDRQQAAAERRVEVARRKAKVGPQAAAWNLARAIHLSEVEDPAQRLELLLQTSPDNRREWAELQSGSKNPAELKAAARKLADAGRIKTVRGRTSGSLYLEVTNPLSDKERAELERGLLRLMVIGRVSEPKGTALARRVAAHRGVLTRETREAKKAELV